MKLLSHIKQNQNIKWFYNRNESLLQCFIRKVYNYKRERYRILKKQYRIEEGTRYGQVRNILKRVHREMLVILLIKIMFKLELLKLSSKNNSF